MMLPILWRWLLLNACVVVVTGWFSGIAAKSDCSVLGIDNDTLRASFNMGGENN